VDVAEQHDHRGRVPLSFDTFGQGLFALDSPECHERIGTLPLAINLSECCLVSPAYRRQFATQACDLGVSRQLLGRRGGRNNCVG